MALLISVAFSPSVLMRSGINPDAHRIKLLRTEARFTHTVQAAQLIYQVDLRVVGEEERIVLRRSLETRATAIRNALDTFLTVTP